jgi:hypothetical protein
MLLKDYSRILIGGKCKCTMRSMLVVENQARIYVASGIKECTVERNCICKINKELE